MRALVSHNQMVSRLKDVDQLQALTEKTRRPPCAPRACWVSLSVAFPAMVFCLRERGLAPNA